MGSLEGKSHPKKTLNLKGEKKKRRYQYRIPPELKHLRNTEVILHHIIVIVHSLSHVQPLQPHIILYYSRLYYIIVLYRLIL